MGSERASAGRDPLGEQQLLERRGRREQEVGAEEDGTGHVESGGEGVGLRTKGVGHLPTSEIVETEYQKMRQRVRTLYPSQVWLQTNRPDVSFNRIVSIGVRPLPTPCTDLILHTLLLWTVC